MGLLRRADALLPARRAALGLGATALPSIAFVALGVALGPDAIGIISAEVLGHLDPVVSVALAILGIFAGLGLAAAWDRRALGAATIEASITIMVVSGAMYVLFRRWTPPLPMDAWTFALVLGVCSCSSAAIGVRRGATAEAAARLADFEDVPIIALGAILMAAIPNGPDLFVALAATSVVGITIGVAGLLLFERAHSEAERGAFVAGTTVLLGGAAAYLNTSPLLSGFAAALVWARAPGVADRMIGDDLGKLQHPLVALLTIVGGASIQWNVALLWLTAPLVLFRLTGKLLGSAAVSRIARAPASVLASFLVPPGVIGVALALNIQQALASGGTSLVSAVVVAAITSELLALAVLPGVETRA
jgi:hypothetical protein